MRLLSSRFTSGRSKTPRTTLKMAAFTPIPRASVNATVVETPGFRTSERNATLISLSNPAYVPERGRNSSEFAL